MPQFRRKTKRNTNKKGGKKDAGDASSGEEEEQVAAPAPDVKEEVAALKDEGNTAFSAGKWEVALAKFSEAIRLEPTNHILYSNRSGTNLQMLRTRDAVSDAQECVNLMPSWAKGYSRLGAALMADKQAVAAKAAYEKGLTIEPANATLLQGLASAKPAAEEEEARVAQEKAEEEAAAKPKTSDPADNVVIGIDLGTTFSCVGVWQNGAVEILEDEGGSRTTPSFVAFTEDGGRLVGEAAKGQAARNVTNTFYDIKRILGQKFSEHCVRDEVKRFPFEVVADDKDDPRIVVPALENKRLPPEQVSGLVLGHMKRIAERRLGHPVKKAVVTVPAYFNDAQRQATKAAGAIAGLQVLRIINEPTAAALAYGLDKKRGDDGGLSSNVLIYDLGGGTFDVSILKMEEGLFQVLATGGDTHLGGEDFDNVVVDHFVDILKKKHSVDAKADQKLLRKLRNAVEKGKRALSNGTNAHIEVEDYCLELTRAKFESLNKATFDRTMETVRKVLKDAKLDAKDVHEIVLVGGSTRIPRIQEQLSEAFGGRQLCKAINPDEAVAYGAAVQGAILSGVRNAATDALLLVDVTPLSLGIETEGKHFSVLIPRNTNIPCKKSSTFTTTENYQESIDICVYEGERPCTDGNRLLGQFTIHNIERAKREEPQIEVSFELDANGILNVSARDKKTGATADTRIEGACKGLDQADINRMVQEAEDFAREDELYREQSETKAELESAVWDILDRAESTGNSDTKEVRKAKEIQEWLETLTGLGKTSTGRQLDARLRELRG